MTNVKNKKNRMTAPRNPNSKADANVIRVPNDNEQRNNWYVRQIMQHHQDLPSMMTNPVNVIITVAMAKTMKMMNGNAHDKTHIDMPNAKNGCRDRCCTTKSITSYAPYCSSNWSNEPDQLRPWKLK